MSRYLQEAAELLRKADSANKYNEHTKRVEIAREFAILAAIDKGLMPAEYADRIRNVYGEDD